MTGIPDDLVEDAARKMYGAHQIGLCPPWDELAADAQARYRAWTRAVLLTASVDGWVRADDHDDERQRSDRRALQRDEARAERDQWIANCATACQTKDEVLAERDHYRDALRQIRLHAEGQTPVQYARAREHIVRIAKEALGDDEGNNAWGFGGNP